VTPPRRLMRKDGGSFLGRADLTSPWCSVHPFTKQKNPSAREHLSTPKPPRTTLTKPPNNRNNAEVDSPPSVITPPSWDPPAKVAPAVRATVEPAERRRAVARSKRKVAKLSAEAEEAAVVGVWGKSM